MITLKVLDMERTELLTANAALLPSPRYPPPSVLAPGLFRTVTELARGACWWFSSIPSPLEVWKLMICEVFNRPVSHTCKHKRWHTCTHTCTHTQTHNYIQWIMHAHAYKHTLTHIHTHTHKRTNKRTYTHTYTQTNTNTHTNTLRNITRTLRR